ncbi:MAG: HPr family phosphocarrier protein [Alphaproteobacteria bacterium]|nr:HPr family phosphocarrier protein [Alphaproteobacteria bacterium]
MTLGVDGWQRCNVTIVNQLGLHARAAAKFVRCAERFQAEIQVTKAEQTVSALSIMGLMMLAAGMGTELELAARGPQAAAALEALAVLVADKFQEN